jgi:hypothetical protein
MAPLDPEIDRLYQLPLAEFTSARAALAKRRGSDAAAIRKLQKPSVAAWAVNQLYWRDRATYSALAAAAHRLRAAQVAALSGKSDDVARAEAEQSSARRDALGRVRAILEESGEHASAATLTAINETLEALPAADPGRLVRPLKPMGFEGLAGLLAHGGRARHSATVVPFPSPAKGPARKGGQADRPSGKSTPAARKREAQEAKRIAANQRREMQRMAAALRKARAEETKAEASARQTRAELTSAERDRDRAAKSLEAAEAKVSQLAERMRNAEQELAARRASRAKLEDQTRAAQR